MKTKYTKCMSLPFYIKEVKRHLWGKWEREFMPHLYIRYDGEFLPLENFPLLINVLLSDMKEFTNIYGRE